MITCQVEAFAAISEEVQPLLECHWEEIADYKDFIPLSPNFARYAEIEAAGKLLVITARSPKNELVGYAAFQIDFSDHYCTTLWAQNRVIWIAKEYRRIGVGSDMISLAERELAGRGVAILQIKSKTGHAALGMLLDDAGYARVEIVHAKVLQRPESE